MQPELRSPQSSQTEVTHRVIVVDDNPDFFPQVELYILAAYAAIGISDTQVKIKNYDKPVKAMQSFLADSAIPDVVISDVQMPLVDGTAVVDVALSQYTRLNDPQSSAIILAVSSANRPEELRESVSFVCKSQLNEELLPKLTDQLRKKYPPQSEQFPAATPEKAMLSRAKEAIEKIDYRGDQVARALAINIVQVLSESPNFSMTSQAIKGKLDESREEQGKTLLLAVDDELSRLVSAGVLVRDKQITGSSYSLV